MHMVVLVNVYTAESESPMCIHVCVTVKVSVGVYV